MIELVKQYAMEKYAGDKEAVESFMEGFTKQASLFSTVQSAITAPSSGKVPSFGESVTKGLGEAAGKGLMGIGLGLGLHGLNAATSHVANMSLHSDFLKALTQAVQSNPVLKNADEARVLQYGETIFKFAPHIAGDANLLSSILANAVHGEGIDPMTIKTLGDLESRYVDNRSAGAFSPKSYV